MPDHKPGPAKGPNVKHWIAGAVFLLTFALYLTTLRNGFVDWDDPRYIYENPNIHKLDLAFLSWAFSSFSVSNWHPLTWISHALDYAAWGLDPAGHHLTNVLFHAVNAFLVVILAAGLTLAAKERAAGQSGVSGRSAQSVLIVAGLTGVLFGIHPLHVESVAWISERKDVLCAFFFLLSILAYMKYVDVAKSGSAPAGFMRRLLCAPYSFSLGFFALALLSKPMAVTLPAVLLIIDWYPYRRIGSGKGFVGPLMEKLPFFTLSLVSSWVTLSAQRSGQALMPLIALPLSTRISTAVMAIATYLWKMLYPIHLIAFYPYPLRGALISLDYFLPVALLVVVTGIALAFVRRQRLLLAAWAYFLVTLLPVLGLVQVGPQAMADRYTYLPSLGPFVVFAAGVAWGFERARSGDRPVSAIVKSSVFAVTLAVFFALSYQTERQIMVWRSSFTLWDHVIKTDPEGAYVAYVNRGKALETSMRHSEAIEDFTTAMTINPYSSAAYYERAVAYDNEGLWRQAIEDYDRTIALAPDNGNAYLSRAIIYEKADQLSKAISDYSSAIDLNPANYEAYNYRGGCFINAGQPDRAVSDFSRAIALKPDYEDAYNNRGIALEKLGEFDRAIADYTTAIGLNPLDYSSFNNRGLAYGRKGLFDKAIEEFGRAISIKPTYELAYHNRGLTYYQNGSYDRALHDFGMVISLDPGNGAAYTNRGYVYLGTGKKALARADFANGCALGNDNACKALREAGR